MTGCKQDTTIEQLRAENPFKRPEVREQERTKKPRISTLSLKLVVPESVGVSELEIFRKYKLSDLVDKKGFNVLDKRQSELWSANGFEVAIAPKSMFEKTLTKLRRYYDQETIPWLNIYKSAKEFSDLEIRAVTTESIVPLKDSKVELGELNFGGGDYLLRYQATIINLSQIDENRVNFFIIPVFRPYMPHSSMSVIAGVENLPVTGIEELVLSGTIENDQVIAITCSESGLAGPCVANEMLYDRDTRSVKVIFIMPEARMVE
ncbi:MAG: hypothetical protein JW745_06900 [Sedimentisphaerales bacterium]|nr:hypothetical protein [Sedimentisphaerales bacterium]MBN2843236.1 hypothetical protein [Sedimentisphaerales bacterium]